MVSAEPDGLPPLPEIPESQYATTTDPMGIEMVPPELDLLEDTEMTPAEPEKPKPLPVRPKVSRVPRPHTITAENVNEISHMNKIAQRRETRSCDPSIKEALEAVSSPSKSLTRAVTIEEVDDAHLVRSQHRAVLQEFETSNARLKDLQTKRLRTKRAWNKLGASERHYVQEAGRDPSVCKWIKYLLDRDGHDGLIWPRI